MRQRVLFEASAKAAPETSVVHVAALAGLLGNLMEDDPTRALELSRQLAQMSAIDGSLEPALIAADAYERLLPAVPLWWRIALPPIPSREFAPIVAALADASERRGDRVLSRRLRERGLASAPGSREADDMRAKLAVVFPVEPPRKEAARRMSRLLSDCRGDQHVAGSSEFAFGGTSLTQNRGLSGPGADLVRSCLSKWASTYLRGLPPIRVTVAASPAR
jgi:hypothetical protein